MSKVPNHTKDEALKIIQRLAKNIAPNFTFGYYDREDIEQEAIIMGLEALSKYSPVDDAGKARKLDNFIYIHMRNRLTNLMRNKFFRAECPCKLCRNTLQGESGHPDGRYCQKFVNWRSLNNAKAGLMNPIGLSTITEDGGEHLFGEEFPCHLTSKELQAVILDELSPENKELFLLMKEGAAIGEEDRELLADDVKSILARHMIDDVN